jgi:hypothetical protein
VYTRSILPTPSQPFIEHNAISEDALVTIFWQGALEVVVVAVGGGAIAILPN